MAVAPAAELAATAPLLTSAAAVEVQSDPQPGHDDPQRRSIPDHAASNRASPDRPPTTPGGPRPGQPPPGNRTATNQHVRARGIARGKM